MPRLPLTAPLLLALIFVGAAPAGAQFGMAPDLTPIPEAPPAPAFDLLGPDGKRYSLEGFRGRPVIVNFWATWCPPCRAEMPSMQRAWQQIEDEGIGMLAINVGDEPEDIQQFLTEVPVTFPLPMDSDSRVAMQWPMRGLPTTFVVDAEGRLVYRAAGERDWDDQVLLDQVRALRR